MSVPAEYAQSGPLAAPLMLVGTVDHLHVRVDIDEQDAWRIKPNAPATAAVRGNARLTTPIHFVRYEPYVVPKRALSGATSERVDTRVLQVIYRLDEARFPLYVGQQLDVFLGGHQPGASLPAADGTPGLASLRRPRTEPGATDPGRESSADRAPAGRLLVERVCRRAELPASPGNRAGGVGAGGPARGHGQEPGSGHLVAPLRRSAARRAHRSRRGRQPRPEGRRRPRARGARAARGGRRRPMADGERHGPVQSHPGARRRAAPSPDSTPSRTSSRLASDAIWELDIWGRVRRGIEAAEATLEAAEDNRRDVLGDPPGRGRAQSRRGSGRATALESCTSVGSATSSACWTINARSMRRRISSW